MKSLFKRNKSKRSPLAPIVAFGAAAVMGTTLLRAEDEPTVAPIPTEPTSQPNSQASPTTNTTTATSAPVAIENTESTAVEAAPLPEVIVTGDRGYMRDRLSSPKYTEPVRDIPQTVTVIPKDVMRDQNATSLRDVLRNVPGISMQAGEGGVPAGDNLSIRGFNARTDFYSDGMRDLGGYFRDPFNLEQVEVAKGPSSTTGGRGSTGGSINQVSKMPSLEKFGMGSFGFGTDNYKRTTIDINQPIASHEGTAVRVNGMWHDADTPRRTEVDSQRWGVAPAVSFGLASPTRLTLAYYHLTQHNQPDYGIPFVPETNTALPGDRGRPAPVPLENYYGLLDKDYEKTDTDIYTGIFQHDFNDSMSLRNTARLSENTRDSIYTSPRFVSNSTTTINRQFQSRDQKDEIIANQTDLTWNFKTGPIGHSADFGVEVAREKQQNFIRTGAPAPTADLYEPNPYESYAGQVRRTGTQITAIAESQALYAFDTVKVGDKIEIPLGLRWESFDVNLASSTPNMKNVHFGRDDQMLSWRGAFVFKPAENSSIYAGYGTSFNPSAEGLTSGFNPDLAQLDPEKSKSYEVGTKWEVFRRRLLASFALFRTEKTNARTPGLPGEAPTVLNGEQRVDGVELGASGNITRNWQFFGGYTYMKSEVLKSNTPTEVGRNVSNTPANSFSLWTNYTFPTKLQIGGGAQYVDKRYANNANSREVGSYIKYDAMASYPVTERVNVRLNVNNVFDEEYYDSLSGGHTIPGAGRSATFTTDVTF